MTALQYCSSMELGVSSALQGTAQIHLTPQAFAFLFVLVAFLAGLPTFERVIDDVVARLTIAAQVLWRFLLAQR